VPHIVLQGRVTLDDVAGRFEPFVVKDGTVVIKVERFYRERDGRAALLETLVADRGHTQKFLIQLIPRDDGLTVRLDPLTDPEKTPAVKRALAAVADRIVRATGCAYARSNIEDYLIRGGGP
jgi:hypothetical protein